MPKEVLRYDLIQHICFEISGKDLNPDKANPVIKEFHGRLDDFHYESDPFIVNPTAIDEFKIREIDGSRLIGSYQIRWEIIDLDKENAMYRKNSEIRPLITRLVSKISVERGLASKIILKVVNSRFNDEFKEGVWPDSNLQDITL